jgi:predicted alpha/beta superfamily hydrolase
MTSNVTIIDNDFYMPQLGRTRRIWLYLPRQYHESDRRYPVIYMHDGQNLFDQASAFAEAWQVDEKMDDVGANCIIVGIDNGAEKRLTEYNFHHHHKFGKPEGQQYVGFIIHTLKPFIDQHFRTLPGRDHTLTAGSSMGGLISFFAAFHYPETFGGAGILSPSFWLVPRLKKELKNEIASRSLRQRFYFYAGGREGSGMVENVLAVADVLKRNPAYAVDISVNPDGEHKEAIWREQMPLLYYWVQDRSNEQPGKIS